MRERVSKDGITTYQVMFRNGKKQSSLTFADRKSAKAFEDKIRVLGVRRALEEAEPGEGGVTLDELAADYWEYKKTRVRSDRTVADYERDYRNWIAPELGWRPAADIDENDVQAWVERMRKATKVLKDKSVAPALSAKSIGDRHAILHGIFKWASAPRQVRVPLGHNPCVGTELPKKRRKPPQGLRPAEWQALYIALKKRNSDAADLAEFLIASGWRWSEATALDAFNVEDNGTYCHVTMSRVARRDAQGRHVLVDDGKGDASMRRIKLDAEASASVRRRLAGRPNGGLVFTTSQGSQWHYSNFYSRFWIKAVEDAKSVTWRCPGRCRWRRFSDASVTSRSRRPSTCTAA
jgi:integrase